MPLCVKSSQLCPGLDVVVASALTIYLCCWMWDTDNHERLLKQSLVQTNANRSPCLPNSRGYIASIIRFVSSHRPAFGIIFISVLSTSADWLCISRRNSPCKRRSIYYMHQRNIKTYAKHSKWYNVNKFLHCWCRKNSPCFVRISQFCSIF